MNAGREAFVIVSGGILGLTSTRVPADFDESATLVAVTRYDQVPPFTDGAVYKPLLVIVPAAQFAATLGFVVLDSLGMNCFASTANITPASRATCKERLARLSTFILYRRSASF